MLKKIAVIGSRSFSDEEYMRRVLFEKEKLHAEEHVLVSGGAPGEDFLAERISKVEEIPFVLYPANWERHGRRAGMLRNIAMIQYVDEVIAFWDGKSSGTQHSINLAEKFGKPVRIYMVNNYEQD